MPENVLDLDILRPEPRYIKLGGKTIDVSFVPNGITFEVDEVVQELIRLQQGGKNDKVTQAKQFQLTVKMCSVFCAHKNSEMDEQWFMENTEAQQLHRFAEEIKDALFRSYIGAEAYQKNAETVQPTGK